MSAHNHKVTSGLICENDLSKIREAVCIQVEKIYDSCKEKDCIENAKVLFACEGIQKIINKAINVKARKAEVVDVYADIEPVPFKRGFYTVDVKFFIRVTLDFFVPNMRGTFGTRIITRNGLVVFDKKVILFGSEGNVKIFKSHFEEGEIDKPIRSRLQQDNLPISKVEVAEPIALMAKIEDPFDRNDVEFAGDSLPQHLRDLIGDEDEAFEEGALENEREDHRPRRRVVVTLGLFSIIKLVRFVQLLVPAFDFCIPNKDCIASTEENPCELFDTITFPFDEFFPPQKFDFPGALEAEKRMIEQMND